MIPKHWYKYDYDRSNFEKTQLNRAIEDFDNSTELKIYQGKVKRYVGSQNILFQLNIEERRKKMRSLLDAEEKQIEFEWFQRLVTQDARRQQLKDHAQRIRFQKEVERQAIADEKYLLREILSNDNMRSLQINLHKNEIKKDRKKLIEIKDRLIREENCEKQFWAAKTQEEYDKMMRREEIENAKRNAIQTDIRDQIKANEAFRNQEWQKELELRKQNNDQAVQLLEDIKKEKEANYLNDLKMKADYRRALDKHINLRNAIKDKEKERLDSFDKIMNDENFQKIHQSSYDVVQKKHETFKHMTDYITQTRCIKESQEMENKMQNEMFITAQIEKEKRMRQLEAQKQKKYKDLIMDIKAAQKNQLLEADRQKSELWLQRDKEKQAMQEFILKEEAKEKIALAHKKKKIDLHNAALMEQINFNKYNKGLELEEKRREAEAMKEADDEYVRRCREMEENNHLVFKHPWRKNTV